MSCFFDFFCTSSLHSKSAHHNRRALTFLGLLAFLQPAVQKSDDDILHLLGRVGFGEILFQGVMAQCNGIVERLLFLGYDLMDRILGQRALLAFLLDPLCLGQ